MTWIVSQGLSIKLKLFNVLYMCNVNKIMLKIIYFIRLILYYIYFLFKIII